ncbi:hypothetical protein Pyn_04870 [Prunus yedoensis var. nudiflora]|uniref:LysM domain-containing protein n=1 Tax=Prunus yedoensis var. nudiflora TaxID=2094558 RepID=A0A314UXZ4_PRUYE|nr:hypothetical protein Pyn_04870 [Prunus yedoensis var. nudiflora]
MAVIMSKNKLTMSLNLVLVLCLFLIISFAEGKQLGTTPRCQKVYGVEAGDTCNGIMQKFKLNADSLQSILTSIATASLWVNGFVLLGQQNKLAAASRREFEFEPR